MLDIIYSYIIILMIIYNTTGMYCSNVKITWCYLVAQIKDFIR
jgi:hypothetical protein